MIVRNYLDILKYDQESNFRTTRDVRFGGNRGALCFLAGLIDYKDNSKVVLAPPCEHAIEETRKTY